jgi:hypothetical protein
MKHKHFGWIMGIIFSTVVVALVIFLVSGKRNAEAPTKDSEGGTITTTTAPKLVSVAEDSYLYGITGSYPQFSQADAVFNTKIAKVFKDSIADFKKAADEDYQAHLKIDGEEFKSEFAKGNRSYYFNVNTSVVQSDDTFISVLVREDGYTGGAHPFHSISTFNYDIKNHKELSITDFMTLKELSDMSRKDLRDQFTKKGDAGTFEMFAIDGTDPLRPENFQNFTVTPSAFVIYFNEYQVAPYVYGEMSVTIPRK